MPYTWGTPPTTGQTNPRHPVLLAVRFFGVTDIESSLRFYADGLGFVRTNEWSPEGRIRWCWLELDEVLSCSRNSGATAAQRARRKGH